MWQPKRRMRGGPPTDKPEDGQDRDYQCRRARGRAAAETGSESRIFAGRQLELLIIRGVTDWISTNPSHRDLSCSQESR